MNDWPERDAAVQALPIERRHDVCALWMTDQRVVGSTELELLASLDEDWSIACRSHLQHNDRRHALRSGHHRILTIIYPDSIEDLDAMTDLTGKQKKIRDAVLRMGESERHQLFATWMTRRMRDSDDQHIDILLIMDREWERVYKDNRIKIGFHPAQEKANKMLLEVVYGHKTMRL